MSAAGDLLCLVYTSSASQPFRETALEHLLEECRRLNDARDVTGMLLHRSGRFIQVLEGDPEVVRDLVEHIRRDSRHHDMRILLEETIDHRRFPEWTMGYRAFRGDPGLAPAGYRDSFADLDADADRETTVRALSELTLWFRVRAARSA